MKLRKQNVPSAYSQARRHGLAPEEIDLEVKRQNGKCIICLRALGGDYVIDHDHEAALRHPHPPHVGCKKCFRGILHRQCNASLGVFKDDPIMIRRAARYIELWRERHGSQ